MKLLLPILLLLTIPVTAKPKYGTLRITTTPQMRGTIMLPIGGDPNGPSKTVISPNETPYQLLPGVYQVEIELPTNELVRREIHITAGKVCVLSVSYTAPTTVTKVETVEHVVEVEKPCPVEEKPPLTRRLFDTCCNCKSDDLKARLDLFAIELNRDPSNRGSVSSNKAIDYLIAKRGISPDRLISTFGGSCVELWIVPLGAK